MLKRQVAQAAIVGRATECLSTAKMMWNTSSISLPAPYDRFGWLLVDSEGRLVGRLAKRFIRPLLEF